MMVKKSLFILFFVWVCNYGIAQNFTISRFAGNNPVTDQSFIYALPRTGLNITLELTKTTIKAGLYAEYAQKYLGLTNVPKDNSEFWTISDIKINPFNEPDPDQYYSLSFKTFPENLQSIFSMDSRGVVLGFSDNWKNQYFVSESISNEIIEDPLYIDEVLKEKVDTLYKTVMTDSTFTRIPVFKKQIVAKNTEELAKETAYELIKTRKHRIKLARGEYDYHPDARTLEVMTKEMNKLEDYYLSLFQGQRIEQKFTIYYTVFPSKDLSSQDLAIFSKDHGITKLNAYGTQSVSVQFMKEYNQPLAGLIPDKQSSNMLYFRVPVYIKVTLFIDQVEKVQSRIPFYQFGSIQGMNLKK